jgi:hypothetical protein
MESLLRKSLLAMLLLGLSAPACAQCGPENPPYRGQMFDAMAQIDSNMSDRVLSALQDTGIRRIALFGRWKLDERGGGGSGRSEVLALYRAHPELIVPGATKVFVDTPGWNDRILREMTDDLDEAAWRFVGELLVVHADKVGGSITGAGERTTKLDSGEFSALMQKVVARHVPMMLHWEVYDWERDWPAMSAIYSASPQVTFIWPHGGFGSADQVRTVIQGHPNVVVTLSKRIGDARATLRNAQQASKLGDPVIDECRQMRPEWLKLLQDYPERFMFATDAHDTQLWERYGRIVRRWRGILGQLPPELARGIAVGNASRIYGVGP